jgi:hypothetical protein
VDALVVCNIELRAGGFEVFLDEREYAVRARRMRFAPGAVEQIQGCHVAGVPPDCFRQAGGVVLVLLLCGEGNRECHGYQHQDEAQACLCSRHSVSASFHRQTALSDGWFG